MKLECKDCVLGYKGAYAREKKLSTDLDPLQLFSHVFSPIVNLMVHKLKKTLEKREKKHHFHL
jgi:hypothetical protein